MLSLAIRVGGHRVAALFAVACAALGGAALITGTGVLAESGLRSHVPTGRLAGADVVIAADQTYRPAEDLPIPLPERAAVPKSTVDRLAGLPGAVTVAGDVSFPAAIIGPGDRVVPMGDPRTAGHGWASVALLDGPRVEGTAPAGPGEVAVDAAAGVRPGERVRVVAAGETREYRVSAVVGAPGAGILFDDATAARLAGRDGAVDLIGMRAEPGRAASVAAAARERLAGSGLTVATGTGRGDLEAPGAAAARSLLLVLSGSLAGTTLLVVGFIMAGAMTVSVAGQRRDLALLRAVGATPGQIRRLAAGQATVATAAAVVPGAAFGYLLAERFRLLLVDQGMLPAELPLTRGPLPVVAAALLLVAVARVAARSAAWRTSRRPATEAVAESRSEPRGPSPVRTTAGLLLIAGATALSAVPLVMPTQVGAAATPLAGIVAAIGLGLAGPDLVRRAGAGLARRLPEHTPATTWLAVANTHGYALRIAGAVTTLAMAVLFTLTYALTQTTLMSAVSGEVRAGTRADATVTAPGLGGLPAGALDEIRAVPGVRAAAPVSATTVLWTTRMFGEDSVESTSALILTPAAKDVLDLGLRAGTLDALTGAAVALDAGAAADRGVDVGGSVRLILGDGSPATARVAAIYDRGLGFGPVVLSRDLTAGHTGSTLDQSILVRTDGTPPARSALAALVASRPGLDLDGDGDGGAPGGLGGTPAEVWVNLVVLGVLLGYLLLGIANKVVAATSVRATELAALRLIGATPRQLRSMMRREATLVVGFAVTVGVVLALVPLMLLGTAFLHRPWAAGPLWLLPACVLVVAAVAFLATDLPTRQALRTTPFQALTARG
ncbi:FtsX-like permease family protein [Dactylosporangium roseum]|uniref:FtsX-like permease family protein n=1 Tax=Dactylosporangium roseum TaxID=47989 RepID=A0ABY5ZDL9_9ACTN|nr:FtsX-like permease family protein [Dactylosporangium roseum]UWZ38862.1 FtsX-like permease family protein [Dactylosporangium roseum]